MSITTATATTIFVTTHYRNHHDPSDLGHGLCDLDHVSKRDVSSVHDVLGFLVVPLQLLQRLDDEHHREEDNRDFGLGEAEGAIGQSSEPAKTTGPGGERERTA
ncbi:60S ribosomal protein like [Actinidia chinensis var. chinensis]|uniref:60S ribosomal protein like n=1 Tax=Actinidia chinensis var. chinensis TaxID=1590841 RepID=A0A2R6R3V6_ACTCC|nr:60S ribosomal protein like [Actinidia chinensis var. chinensis]